MNFAFWNYYYLPFLSALPITSILFVGKYVLYSWGLYGMADHTGIRPSWLAWIPVFRLYTAGQLADRYNQSQNKRSCYRFLLPCFNAIGWILLVMSVCFFFASFIQFFQWRGRASDVSFFLAAIFFTVSGFLIIAKRILELICYYKIFCDYEPSNSALYTILCVLKLECIALFLCRNNVPVGIAGRCHPRQPRYNIQ